MDEGQLTGLFADAAEQAGRSAPPPSFDHDAVLAGSARAAARARRWQTGVVAAAVVAVAGAGLVGVQRLATGPSTSSTLAQPAPGSRPSIAQRRAAPDSDPGTFGSLAAPQQPPMPGAAPKQASPYAMREQSPHPYGAPNAPHPYGAPNSPGANQPPTEPAPAAPNDPEPYAAPNGGEPPAAPNDPEPYAAPNGGEPPVAPSRPEARDAPRQHGPNAAPRQAVPYAMPKQPVPSAPLREHGPGTMPRPEGAAPIPYGARPEPFDARPLPGPGGCGPPDRMLFNQVTAALPATRGTVAQPLDGVPRCPAGARAVQVRVNDHGAAGVLRVLLVPAGSGGSIDPGQSREVQSASAQTASGARVTVWATAAGLGHIPYAGQLTQLAHALAAQNP
jgi:hypothetical protein